MQFKIVIEYDTGYNGQNTMTLTHDEDKNSNKPV